MALTKEQEDVRQELSLFWPDRILNGGKIKAGQRATFTARALFFRCRSFYLHWLAVRVEIRNIARVFPSGVAKLVGYNPGLADPLVIVFMCMAVNPEIRLMHLNDFNHIQRIKSRHERGVYVLGVRINDRRMMRDDNTRP